MIPPLREWFSKLDNELVVFACESKNDIFVKSAIANGFSVFSTTTIQASHLRKLTHLSGKKDKVNSAMAEERVPWGMTPAMRKYTR